VLFDWDEKSRQLWNSLKPGGLALFIGALPCSSTFKSTAGLRLQKPLRETVSGNPFDNFDVSKLPPLSSASVCKAFRVLPQNVYITASMAVPSSDTVNILFSGRMGNRNFIACTATDIWQWDFLPLAVDPDEERVYAFSEKLIAFAREMLVNALSEELYLYPAFPPVESDSLGFTVVFPVDVPVPADIRVSCTFTSTKAKEYDTTFIMKSTGAPRQSVRFKPLVGGAWRLEASASADNRTYRFTDSVTVGEDRSEYLATSQNTALLQEIAQPITDLSQKSISTLFFANNPENNQPTKKTIHLNRTWWLLLLIFAIFGAEWLLRRGLRLD